MVRNVPHQGDIVSIDLSPHRGHEQSGRRPALVLSPKFYNQKTGMMIGCPITSKMKGYPFEILLPPICKTKGVILVDQVKSVDWRARGIRYLERIPRAHLEEVIAILSSLIQRQ